MDDTIAVGDFVRCCRSGAIGRVKAIWPVQDQFGRKMPDLVAIDTGEQPGKGILRDRPSLMKIRAS